MVLAVSAVGVTSSSVAAAAHRSFVTIQDDGTLAAKLTDASSTVETLMASYDKTGAKRPDVISVWTAFPMEKGTIGTRFLPVGNDVAGIGLESVYGGKGTFTSDYPPVRAILLHNDFTKLASRAKFGRGPEEGYARYLFLLELSHVWGPALRVPAGDGGSPEALIGFDFHWSFWMSAGGSPAGGNDWKDNGNGTFTTNPQTPTGIRFSMLDLYAMGLADPSEVPPFALLEGAVAPTDATDPFTNRTVTKTAFPWFDAAPLTVTATKRTFTIDDVIAATGKRTPARMTAPLTLGVVLAVQGAVDDPGLAAVEAAFEPLAASLAPSFADSTGGRGSMEVVTSRETAEPDGTEAPPAPAAPVAAAPEGEKGTTSSGGCASVPAEVGAGAVRLVVGGVVVGAMVRRRRSRSRRG